MMGTPTFWHAGFFGDSLVNCTSVEMRQIQFQLEFCHRAHIDKVQILTKNIVMLLIQRKWHLRFGVNYCIATSMNKSNNINNLTYDSEQYTGFYLHYGITITPYNFSCHSLWSLGSSRSSSFTLTPFAEMKTLRCASL